VISVAFSKSEFNAFNLALAFDASKLLVDVIEIVSALSKSSLDSSTDSRSLFHL